MDPIARYADLAQKTVFISGGATGIGADLVRAFCAQDANVYFVDVDENAGRALASELRNKPRFIACDVTDDDALIGAIDVAEASGGVDVLVNNAANDTRHDFEDIDESAWRAIVDVNLRHQFVAARHVSGLMKGRNAGSIVNLGSIAPEMMVANLAVYSMCKSAVRGMTRSFARDMGGFGVRVNSILPGCILTDRQRALWFREQSVIDEAVARQCLQRELCGDDVAQMALFLASDVSAGCTAQDFIVDGGMV